MKEQKVLIEEVEKDPELKKRLMQQLNDFQLNNIDQDHINQVMRNLSRGSLQIDNTRGLI